MRFLTVPLTLASGPPGLPVLDSVLLPAGHPEDVLSPVRLQGRRGRQLPDELDVGETPVKLLDGVVGDTVGSATEESSGYEGYEGVRHHLMSIIMRKHLWRLTDLPKCANGSYSIVTSRYLKASDNIDLNHGGLGVTLDGTVGLEGVILGIFNIS